MNSLPKRSLFVVFLSLSGACGGDDLLCGLNTVEVEGQCVPVGECVITCQQGTVLDPSTLGCIPELPPRVCDPSTTTEQVGNDGIGVCVGAEASECTLAIDCPPPQNLGSVTICGRIVDVETMQPAVDNPRGDTCDRENPTTGGTCSLLVSVFDGDEFAANPDAAVALDALVTTDECGRFRAEVGFPASGSLAFSIDDGDAFDDQLRTATVVGDLIGGNRVQDRAVYSARAATDRRWVIDGGDPASGASFEENGATVLLFRELDGRAATGVTIDGALYFDEPGDRFARLDPAASSTGANGGAITLSAPAVPTRSGAECTSVSLPFYPGVVHVVPVSVTGCP